jgi:BMFP domain-containing protein YqiC
MAEDIFSALRTYIGKMSGGEKSASEMSAALASWIKESSEGFKARIESEIEGAAAKMGFVRKEELEELIARISKLEQAASTTQTKPASKPATRSPTKSTSQQTSSGTTTSKKKAANK